MNNTWLVYITISKQLLISFMKHPIACYFVGIGLLGFLFFSIVLVLAIHLHEIAFLERTMFIRTSGICASFGMLGSSVAAIRKYYRVLITESATKGRENFRRTEWDFGWVFYYLTRPILGAVLGGLSFLLIFILFDVLAGSIAPAKISRHGHLMLYVISLLAGYSVSHVLDRLTVVSKQVFAQVEDSKGL